MDASRQGEGETGGGDSYKVQFAAKEGLLPAIGLMILPFVIVVVLVKLLPPWEGEASKV